MLQVSGNSPHQVGRFKCLVVVFTSDGRLNKEIDTLIEANTVLREFIALSSYKGSFQQRCVPSQLFIII